ncbi:MAG: Na/Pi cotransporter family protein [Pseudomonadota bacterium]|nr:Na/Pi cotransporter family protein [Pseudomonadota bacterium]
MMEISGTKLLILIAGSAALLLWGARMTRTGMTRAFGSAIRSGLKARTTNRYNAAFLGMLAAAALQSSTAVGLLAASFATSGAITVGAGLAVMLGADVGSAVIAQILSLKVYELWPILFFFGYVVHAIFSERNVLGKQSGRILLGLGLILLSLGTLASAASVVQASDLVHSLLKGLASEPLIALIVAALLTWLAHSSLAILLLLVVLANSGVLAHEHLPYYLVLGVNAGAGLPALVLGLSEAPPARRILVGNFIFRLTGVILTAVSLDYWIPAITSLDVGLGQRLIVLHIAFNVVLLLTFIWFVDNLAELLRKAVPDAPKPPEDQIIGYLDPSAKDVPDLALSAAARETLRMVDIVELMLRKAVEALKTNDAKLCEETRRLDDGVDKLYGDIKLYITDMSRSEMDDGESARAFEIISFTTNLEHAGDTIERSLLDTIRDKIKSGGAFSEEGLKELMDAYKYVGDTIHLATKVFMEKRVDDAKALIRRKEKFRNIEHDSTSKHLERLRSRKPETMATTSFHIDIMRDLKRINSLFASCAYPLLETAGRLKTSRVR